MSARLEVDPIPPQAPRNLPFKHPVSLICTWFGAGLSPKAPGTAGSLAALPFAYLIKDYFYYMPSALFYAAILLFVVGWWACRHYLAITEREDPGEIVVDEVAAMWLLLSMVPFSWQWWLACFLVFRLFDAAKPWPVSLADRKIKGAFGVMFDDVLAALYPLLIWSAFYWTCKLTAHEEWLMQVHIFMGDFSGF